MLTIHCDGSSLGNPGPSSGGFYLEGHDTVYLYGYEHSTNNVGELRAMFMALNYASRFPEEKVHITTDSGYVYDGLTKYGKGWVARHWKGVKNCELFRPTYHLFKEMSKSGRLTIEKVKGHSDHLGNQIINDAVQQYSRMVKSGEVGEGSGELSIRQVFENHPIRYKSQLKELNGENDSI
ncbi:ribonuclease HI family protein [Vibrio phage Va2]|nr:ribonuclease HI family protein [Vibrio phage Va2]